MSTICSGCMRSLLYLALYSMLTFERASSTALAKAAFQTGKTIREVAVEEGVLPESELDELLDPLKMT